ncbi:aminotransferase class I/II-fold pyridoxal phosphate-dependent enzyme [Trinickia sp. Y13]|nr:aminotransferase class I/II-fold pyridoxal phosphate-dependent enzyme [Trinickia sp. Y13]MDG0026272.1 aminotransferase class I/II-fold pyridoxal phosphate-dependent enzyme [Trinickia sp. Y13]
MRLETMASLDVYKKSVKENFLFLKAATNVQELYLRAIPLKGEQGFLIPVAQVHLGDDALLQRLTQWRNRFVHVYPTQFLATLESTRAWLRDRLLAVEDRMLFLVVDKQGAVVGHMGFNSCFNDEAQMELDNIVRGVDGVERGIMANALLTLTEWARKTINVEGFFLRVFADNAKAIDFYRSLGFVVDETIPLTKVEQEGLVSYVACENGGTPDASFLRMSLHAASPEIGKTLMSTAGPSISAKEAAYAFDAAATGWNSNWSRYLTKFEQSFASYVGAKYALATTSCTGALQIALMALDIGPGDEVIVPDMTWVATANAVRYVGATPVFADIEFDTWNLDAATIEPLITPRTKAIVAVHLYGHPARMTRIMEIARQYNLKLVEDAAPAVGAEWEGRRCGSFGDFAAFSFQGAKLLVTGEGGMLVTNNDALYEKALKIWDQGRDPSKVFWIDGHGVKFKMSNVQAALGLAQLERVDEQIEMKRRIARWYREGLEGVSGISLNQEVPGARSIFWMTSVFLHEDVRIDRELVRKLMKDANVDTRPVFPAISQYPIWPVKQTPQPVALRVGQRAINLPSGVCLKRDEVDYVCDVLKKILK